MFFASSSLQIHLVEVLLDHYSPRRPTIMPHRR